MCTHSVKSGYNDDNGDGDDNIFVDEAVLCAHSLQSRHHDDDDYIIGYIDIHIGTLVIMITFTTES